jgi:hypothetical protein
MQLFHRDLPQKVGTDTPYPNFGISVRIRRLDFSEADSTRRVGISKQNCKKVMNSMLTNRSSLPKNIANSKQEQVAHRRAHEARKHDPVAC